MPDRILRATILTSGAVDHLSPPAEVFYRRLMSVVDDFGLFDARASILRAACFPLRVEKVREADILRWLHEMETAELIVLYDVDGKPYLYFRKLGKPRAKFSKFPAPPAEVLKHLPADENICAQMRPYSYSNSNSNAHSSSDSGNGLVSEGEGEAENGAKAKQAAIIRRIKALR